MTKRKETREKCAALKVKNPMVIFGGVVRFCRRSDENVIERGGGRGGRGRGAGKSKKKLEPRPHRQAVSCSHEGSVDLEHLFATLDR